jgi:hypothetical protein
VDDFIPFLLPVGENTGIGLGSLAPKQQACPFGEDAQKKHESRFLRE